MFLEICKVTRTSKENIFMKVKYHSETIQRKYLHKRSSTGMWMDGEGKVQTSKKTGVLSALGEDNLFISPKALLMGPKGR